MAENDGDYLELRGPFVPCIPPVALVEELQIKNDYQIRVLRDQIKWLDGLGGLAQTMVEELYGPKASTVVLLEEFRQKEKNAKVTRSLLKRQKEISLEAEDSAAWLVLDAVEWVNLGYADEMSESLDLAPEVDDDNVEGCGEVLDSEPSPESPIQPETETGVPAYTDAKKLIGLAN